MSKNKRKRRTLKELTIKDNFMFAAVMTDPENCSRLLEMVLNIPIDRVEVDREKSIVYNPQYHGIRLDVYAKDPHDTRYSIEMQVKETPIARRCRYYHSQIDMDLLCTETSYDNLPDVYVIFICDYDPFEEAKYVYTVDSVLRETGKPYEDGSHTIFLSTAGKNESEAAPELVQFLRYVHADLTGSTKYFMDPYVTRLQESVAQIKSSREMERRFMVLEDMLRQEHQDGYEEGKADGIEQGIEQGIKQGIEQGTFNTMRENILDVLSDFGEPSPDFISFLSTQNDINVLKQCFQAVRKTTSLDEFEEAVKSCMNFTVSDCSSLSRNK